MAPECSDGADVGPAADVYSLGVLLYEAVAGRPPFRADSVMALLRAHHDAPPTRPDGVSPALWTLLGRMLEKDPAMRPAAQQVADVLHDGHDLPRVALLPAATNRSGPTPVPRSGQAPDAAPPAAPNAPRTPDLTDVMDRETVLRPMPAPDPAPAGRSHARRWGLGAAAVLLVGSGSAAWAGGLVPQSWTGTAATATGSSTTTAAPTGTPTGTPASATSRAAAVTTSGTIALAGGPGGGTVRGCEYFSGRAALAAGTTLAVTMTNLDNGHTDTYVELVENFRDPSALGTWRGHQYFGSGDTSVGQHYRVQLVAVPLPDAVRAASTGREADVRALAPKGEVLASLKVTRVAGPGVPAGCPLG